MVVRDLDFVGMAVLPLEAQSVLIIETYAVLAGTITPKSLEPIPRWHAQFLKCPDAVQLIELPACNRPEHPRTGRASAPRIQAVENILGRSVRE
jgi:hypothetical protein